LCGAEQPGIRPSVAVFNCRLGHAGPADERDKAAQSARFFGSKNTVVNMQQADIVPNLPATDRANEGPMIDTSAACMIRLAQANRASGNIVALSGEGADESLAGYVWYKRPRPGRLQEWFEPADRKALSPK